MPRNPKAEALRKGAETQRNWVAANEAVSRLSQVRKEAMVRCIEAGCTRVETAALFAVSPALVSNVLGELRKEAS